RAGSRAGEPWVRSAERWPNQSNACLVPGAASLGKDRAEVGAVRVATVWEAVKIPGRAPIRVATDSHGALGVRTSGVERRLGHDDPRLHHCRPTKRQGATAGRGRLPASEPPIEGSR